MKKVKRTGYMYQLEKKDKLLIYQGSSILVILGIFFVAYQFMKYLTDILPILSVVIRDTIEAGMSPEFKLIITIIGIYVGFWILKIVGLFLFDILDQLNKWREKLK